MKGAHIEGHAKSFRILGEGKMNAAMPGHGSDISWAASRGFGVYQYGEGGSVGNAQLLINIVQVDLYCTLGQP